MMCPVDPYFFVVVKTKPLGTLGSVSWEMQNGGKQHKALTTNIWGFCVCVKRLQKMAAQQVQAYLERHRIGALFEVTMIRFKRILWAENQINEIYTHCTIFSSKNNKFDLNVCAVLSMFFYWLRLHNQPSLYSRENWIITLLKSTVQYAVFNCKLTTVRTVTILVRRGIQ